MGTFELGKVCVVASYLSRYFPTPQVVLDFYQVTGYFESN